MIAEKMNYLNSKEVRIKHEAVALILPDAKVSASYSFVPHLSHRQEIYMYPNPFIPALWNQWFQEGKGIPPAKGHVDYVIVDLNNLGKEDRAVLDFLVNEGYFKLIFEQGSIIVAKRTLTWDVFDYSRNNFDLSMKKYRRDLQNKRNVNFGSNLLGNPGFEEAYGLMPRSWDLIEWHDAKAICSFSLDAKFKKKGKFSAKLSHLGLADSRWTQKIFLKPDTYYRLSGWIKTVDVQNKGAGAYLLIDGLNKRTNPLFGSNDWKLVEIEFKTMLAQDEIMILCRLGDFGAPNSGTAYFDAIELKEIL